MAETRDKMLSAPLGLVTELSAAIPHTLLPDHRYLSCTVEEIGGQMVVTVLSEQHPPERQTILLTPENVAILKGLLQSLDAPAGYNGP